MKNRYFFCLLWLGIILFISGCGVAVNKNPGASITSLTKGPYLIYTNNSTSMTVGWQTNRTPSSCSILWGTTSNYSYEASVSENSGSENMHQFFYTITELNPAQRIYYKVIADTISYESSFLPAPSPSTTMASFYAYSDSSSVIYELPIEHNAVVAAILRDSVAGSFADQRQTFIAHAGDFAFFGMDEDSWQNDYFNRNYNDLTKFQSIFPLLGTLGNHEIMHRDKYSYTNDYVNGGKLFRKYWPYSFLPDPNRSYYSFDYGPVHFCVLDQYTWLNGVTDHSYSWEAVNNTGQFTWMKQDLQNTTRPWKIVMFHEPAWTAKTEIGFWGYNQPMRDYYSPIFKQQGIKVVIQGHQHFYSRCATDEIQYLTLGGGGGTMRDTIEAYAPAFVTGESAVYHFARFDIVNPNTMNVTVIDKDNNVIDSFSVNQ